MRRTTSIPPDDRVTWTPRQVDVLRIDGRRCHVLDRGDGPPVVLLHGLGSVGREIALPLQPLSRRYRLIVPDRPGYGGSASLSRTCLRPDEQAGWLRGVLRSRDVRRPIIVAHSIAAAVALCYALRYPGDVAGLVLVAPFCRPTRPAFMPLLRLSLAPVIGRFLRTRIIPIFANLLGPKRLIAAFAPNPVPSYLRTIPFRDLVNSDALKTMAAELTGFNPAMIASRAALHHLDVPTMVLAGAADTTADPELHAAWIARRLPEARLRVLPGAGHMLQHARPNAVMRAVDDVFAAAGW